MGKVKKNKDFSLTFFVGMAIYLTLIVIIGFWPTYFGPLLLGQEAADFGVVDISSWEIHLHAAVFMTWMVLLLTQAILVARNNTKAHTRFGKYGFLFGIILIVVGFFIQYVQIRTWVAQDLINWSQVFPEVLTMPGTVEMLQFITLLGLGYYYRTAPSAHKRYILFATIVLVNAATSRWKFLTGEGSNEVINILMVAPIWVYDFYSDRGIQPATLIGTGILGYFFLNKWVILSIFEPFT